MTVPSDRHLLPRRLREWGTFIRRALHECVRLPTPIVPRITEPRSRHNLPIARLLSLMWLSNSDTLRHSEHEPLRGCGHYITVICSL